MKKIILFLIFLSPFAYMTKAQTTLYGEQVRGANQNAQLVCEPIILTKTMKIIGIEGENSGFWLEGQNGVLQSFYKDEDKYLPEAIGYSLVPGKYWVYPNLLDNKDSGTVKLILE